jgi:FAD/FMN-containing dehydrogenase
LTPCGRPTTPEGRRTRLSITVDNSLAALRRRFRGELVEPGEVGWDDALLAYNTSVVQRPDLVAVPDDVAGVIDVVRYAAAQGLRVATQRTGHNAVPLGAMDGVVLLRTDRLQGVEIDIDRRVARARSGAKWEMLVPSASELGLAALHGSSPDVSIAGYSLGGGVGWYARKLGLSTNSVTAIELVTADGELRRVDLENDPELFWALRGGGGNFGVVTALELQLYAIPEVYAGVLFFPWERSSEVLHAWLEWTEGVPDEMTSVGRILQFPRLPIVPEELQGRSFAIVETIYSGTEADGPELLRPLRALGPEIDTVAMVPPVGIAELHMDPPDPLPYVGEGLMLGPLDGKAIDRLVAAAGPQSGSMLASVEVRHLGGALHRSAPHHGALDTFDCSFLAFTLGLLFDERLQPVMRAQLDAVADALAPYDSGRRYLNLTEAPTDPACFYTPEVYARLRAVKQAVDPDELFRANHPIRPIGR